MTLNITTYTSQRSLPTNLISFGEHREVKIQGLARDPSKAVRCYR